MFYRVPPNNGVRLVGAVWGVQTPNATTGLTVFSDEPSPQVAWFTSTRVPFEAGTGPLQRARGTHPQLNWRLPNTIKLSQSREQTCQDRNQVLGLQENLEQGALK